MWSESVPMRADAADAVISHSYCFQRKETLRYNKKAVLPQGNRAMPQVFFSVEVRQQLSLQV